MAVRLTLICHAPTVAMRVAAFPGDEPLEKVEPVKAMAAASALRRADCCWVAPELRTRQTAETLGFAAVIDPALRECDHGRWQGRTFADIQRTEGEAGLTAWMRDPGARPHGGETLLELMDRAGAWLAARTGAQGHEVAVLHASVIRVMVMHAIGAPAASFWRIDVRPLSRTVLSYNGQWRMQAMGSVAPGE